MQWWVYVSGCVIIARFISSFIFCCSILAGIYFLIFESLTIGLIVVGAGFIGCWALNFLINILDSFVEDAMIKQIDAEKTNWKLKPLDETEGS